LPLSGFAGFPTFHMAHLLFSGLLQVSFRLAEVGLRLASLFVPAGASMEAAKE
jgi:hypothetical protein